MLKKAINDFNGTAIIVSHDREFLDGLVTKIYEFGKKKVREHLGGIYEFLERKRIENLQELEQVQKRKVEHLEKKPIVSENKLDYEARKALNREIRKVEKTVQQTENDVSRLEDEILEMQTELSNPEKASDSEFVMQLQKKERELEQKIYEWEISSEQLEELKAKLK